MTTGNGATPEQHERFMEQALRQAEFAYDAGESPIGAVVVHKNAIVGRGYNRTEALKDPTAHAEIIAITSAAESLGDWRLVDCDLYCTLEPCIMCAGAAVLARVRHIYYGAPEPKFGGCGSVFTIPSDPRLNHRIPVTGGILQERCAGIIKEFFQALREQRRMN
ncbi:MAG TPA: tRNA adenosine(34) deaminase TadA [candidate division Zixibacteria bacterium]|nr:tRNA adenosine(34) deaminase TadA [candidate division Zixibacteria bacterium]